MSPVVVKGVCPIAMEPEMSVKAGCVDVNSPVVDV
jgi:hypothetical protein